MFESLTPVAAIVWYHRLPDPPHFGAFETLGASQPHTAMPRRQSVAKVSSLLSLL
jgi:hypothetical protein